MKKDHASTGIQQHTGTAGRIENFRVGVFLAPATHRGRDLIDRRLYFLEHSWCDDPERRHAAGVPEKAQFAAKPIRHLLPVAFDPPAMTAARLLHWSNWRTRQQPE